MKTVTVASERKKNVIFRAICKMSVNGESASTSNTDGTYADGKLKTNGKEERKVHSSLFSMAFAPDGGIFVRFFLYLSFAML